MNSILDTARTKAQSIGMSLFKGTDGETVPVGSTDVEEELWSPDEGRASDPNVFSIGDDDGDSIDNFSDFVVNEDSAIATAYFDRMNAELYKLQELGMSESASNIQSPLVYGRHDDSADIGQSVQFVDQFASNKCYVHDDSCCRWPAEFIFSGPDGPQTMNVFLELSFNHFRMIERAALSAQAVGWLADKAKQSVFKLRSLSGQTDESISGRGNNSNNNNNSNNGNNNNSNSSSNENVLFRLDLMEGNIRALLPLNDDGKEMLGDVIKLHSKLLRSDLVIRLQSRRSFAMALSAFNFALATLFKQPQDSYSLAIHECFQPRDMESVRMCVGSDDIMSFCDLEAFPTVSEALMAASGVSFESSFLEWDVANKCVVKITNGSIMITPDGVYVTAAPEKKGILSKVSFKSESRIVFFAPFQGCGGLKVRPLYVDQFEGSVGGEFLLCSKYPRCTLFLACPRRSSLFDVLFAYSNAFLAGHPSTMVGGIPGCPSLGYDNDLAALMLTDPGLLNDRLVINVDKLIIGGNVDMFRCGRLRESDVISLAACESSLLSHCRYLAVGLKGFLVLEAHPTKLGIAILEGWYHYSTFVSVTEERVDADVSNSITNKKVKLIFGRSSSQSSQSYSILCLEFCAKEGSPSYCHKYVSDPTLISSIVRVLNSRMIDLGFLTRASSMVDADRRSLVSDNDEDEDLLISRRPVAINESKVIDSGLIENNS